MDIKLVLLDLDDTLLDSNGVITKRITEALKLLHEKGILVAIASGRMHGSLLKYINKLNINTPIISYNGALIRNHKTNEVLYHKPIPIEIAKEVLVFAEKNNVYIQYYTEDEYFFEQHCDISNEYFKSTDIKGIAVGENLVNQICYPPPKLLIITNGDTDPSLLSKLKSSFGDALEITRSKDHYIEVMNKNVNKGIALEKLCTILDIPIEYSIAFGDGLNDLELIRSAHVGVAVDSGNSELKKAADYICESPDDDGPAKFIEKYIINKETLIGGNHG
ncbi:MAG: HAD family phosphatase [Clostridiales bacterium]|nr:HAD family phosphatase [Clostridiales bacterium]